MFWGNHLVSMLLLKLSARDLLALNERRRMVPHLAARWKRFRGSEASEGESSAWAESLVTLAEDLVAADRGNVEMIVECAATTEEDDRPGGPRLIDVVLVGRHPKNGRISVQLVELKRWSTVTRVEEATAEMVRVPGLGEKNEKKKHPVVQLREYHHLFTGDKGPLNGLSFECGGFAYLHNASDESVKPLFDIDVPTGIYARTYTSDGRKQLLQDMRRYFAEDGGASEAELLLQRMNLRNTPLLDAMINSRGEDTVFTLRGAQREVVEDALKAAAQVLDPPEQTALVDNPKRAVFLVTGGAGTGKSAIGLELKARFEAEGRSVKYASGSGAFNSAMQEHVGYGDREFKESFTYFSSFVTPPEPPLDVLICDEAHRIRARSTNRFWPQEKWGKKPQVDELLDASRLTVFFLDEGAVSQARRGGHGETDRGRRGAPRNHRASIPPAGAVQVRWERRLLALGARPSGDVGRGTEGVDAGRTDARRDRRHPRRTGADHPDGSRRRRVGAYGRRFLLALERTAGR
ncbi:hypothetical protein GCM10010405_42290 [Streptomyces macrosporus]|uniref:AAA+ ATPase domain-containing protein n=1 Tax=Streptomyces macrosporus TaxID=44032 RepID=A0ABN3KA88_9ACTN